MEGALSLGEILGALSLTTDLGAGVPFEKGLRTCLVACGLAEALDVDLSDRRAVYFTALLRSLGCTAHASTFAEMFDDDVAVQRELKLFDLGDPAELSAQTRRFAGWAGTGRAEQLSERFRREGPAQGEALIKQVVSPVLWEDCMRNAAAAGATEFWECGPGAVLAGLARRTEKSWVVKSFAEFPEINV